MTKETNNPENPQLSKEEMIKRREEITKFYKEQIPHLKVQAEYEELMTAIEESRAKRLQAQAFLANAYETMNDPEGTPPEVTGNPGDDFSKNSKQKRKLKVQS